RREEVDVAGEPRELDGDHRRASGGLGEPFPRVDDLARLGHVREDAELDPLDVADHREPRHARSSAVANSRIPASKSSSARNPSTVAARLGDANTCRPPPARPSPVPSGDGPSIARASASAISPTVRGVPEATLNVPGE